MRYLILLVAVLAAGRADAQEAVDDAVRDLAMGEICIFQPTDDWLAFRVEQASESRADLDDRVAAFIDRLRADPVAVDDFCAEQARAFLREYTPRSAE